MPVQAPSRPPVGGRHWFGPLVAIILALALSPAAGRVCAQDAAPSSPPEKSGFSLFDPTPASDMRSFSTDRPPKANTPYTVDAGHFQYETDLVVYGTGTAGGVRTTSWTAPDPTLKLGLTNTLDAEVQVTPYQQATTRAAGATTRVTGWGDTVVRLKANLLGDDGGAVAVALLPYVKVPTARNGLGNGSVEGGLILPVSFSASAGFTVVVMPEVDALKDAAGVGRHAVFDFLVNVSHPLTRRWTLYSEVFTTQSTEASDKPVYTWDEALTFALTPNLQFDFGGNFALNNAPPRIQTYAGLSQRF